MPTSYPGGLDAFTNPTASDPLNSATVPHATQHANANDAIEAIEAELGTNPKGAAASVKARIEAIEATGWVTSTRILDGTIVDGDINAAAAIAQSKVANLTTDLAAKAPTASPTFTGVVTAAAGSAGTPSVTFTGATADTGIYSPGADQVGIATAGTAALYVDASQNVGIGATSLGGLKFTVTDGTVYSRIHPNGGIGYYGNTSDHPIALLVNNTERMRIDNAGLITGTGTSLGAWTSWTPTVTSGTGTLTTVTANGYYCQIGKIVHLRARITLTTNGTGATDLRMTMPVAARNVDVRPIGTGRESSVTGKQLVVWALQNGSTAYLVFYDNTYPGGDGRTFDLSMTYEIN